LRHNVDNAVKGGLGLLNIDGKEAPGKYIDIFSAVGRACMKYKLDPEA
jgi:hypothetical protein